VGPSVSFPYYFFLSSFVEGLAIPEGKRGGPLSFFLQFGKANLGEDYRKGGKSDHSSRP